MEVLGTNRTINILNRLTGNITVDFQDIAHSGLEFSENALVFMDVGSNSTTLRYCGCLARFQIFPANCNSLMERSIYV